jgi:hypothetical protein
MPCEKCAEIKTDTINQESCGASDFDPNSWQNCKLGCDCHEISYDESSAKNEEYYPEPDELPEDDYP